MKLYLFVLVVGFLFIISGCRVNKKPLAPLPVVPRVDLERYTGTWYEIARFPHRFQKDCVGSMAVYTLRDDGKLTVVNRCHERSPGGRLRQVKGKAWVVDEATNAKLKVSFFWPFSGDYWIIDLGEKYEYAVVGHPGRKYLWILSRTKTMEEGTYRAILDRLSALRYDTSKLIRTPQE